MQSHFVKMNLKTVFCITLVLLLGAGMAFAQQQVNLTAGASTLTLPDGSSVPMWGYTCAGSTVIASSTATCAPLNAANAAKGQWSPVIITVPSGQDLQINLTNSLAIAGNNIPTSLTIVGQLGGGLGTSATSMPSPQHVSQPPSWPITNTGPEFNPPPQGPTRGARPVNTRTRADESARQVLHLREKHDSWTGGAFRQSTVVISISQKLAQRMMGSATGRASPPPNRNGARTGSDTRRNSLAFPTAAHVQH